MLKLHKCRIGVVGLGYVGLPLAVEFGKHLETVGFDVNPARVAQLRRGRDSTLEVTRGELKEASRLSFTTELQRQFRELGARGVRRLRRSKHVLYDIKHVFPAEAVDGRL